MDFKINQKRALVFGASSGLGKAVAEALVQEKVKVAICSSNEQRITQTAQEIGASFATTCDLYRPGDAAKAVQATVEKLGGIDILVMNAGGPPKGDFALITAEQWRDNFQSLWMSTVEALQAALPKMQTQKWGRVLVVTSAAAREPMAHLTVSNGLRAGLSGLVKSLSNEYAEYGITLNALLPGYTKTERLMELGIPEDKIVANIPARRLGKPEEFGAVAAFLASEQAAYITGQAIPCDGGYLRSI